MYDKEPIEILDTRYTFQNLEHNKTYYIKVETQDAAGRIGMAETSIKTSELLVNNDEAEIVGHRRTYVGASSIIIKIKK